MKIKFIEATNGPWNWGKFLIAEFTADEWARRSAVEPREYLLFNRGWRPDMHKLVVDLQTGEGAIFRMGGLARADLEKHRVWVCPLFEPFLAWLYKQDLRDIAALPDSVDLPDAEFMMSGHRRLGPLVWRAQSPITGEVKYTEDGPTAEALDAEDWAVSLFVPFEPPRPVDAGEKP